MSSHDRRAAARRRAWGRGPIILRFEPLEGRQLLTATRGRLADLVGEAFHISAETADWGDTFNVTGSILNQGKGAVPKAFTVQIVASTTPNGGTNPVIVGTFQVPAGLAAGQSAAYSAQISLPPAAIPNYTAGKPLYISTNVAPGRQVAEQNYQNNNSVGLGYDRATINIVPVKPAQLIGTSFTVSASTTTTTTSGSSTTTTTTNNSTTWGQSVTVSAQIQNDAGGDAPATRAAIVLTPAGVAVGSGSDITIGYLSVPALPAWQTANISQSITLPSTPPTALGGATQFTVSMVQDADFLTNPMYPHAASRGTGLDSAQLAIGAGSGSTSVQNLPDLAAGTVQGPSDTLHWGQTVPVSATVQNVGAGDAGPFNVIFLLTGSDGSMAQAVFLGQTTIDGLAAGASRSFAYPLHIPSKLPGNVGLNSNGTGRIAMLVDPQHAVNENVSSNNSSQSNPIRLRLLGADGTTTIPNTPTPTVTLGPAQPQGTLTPVGGGSLTRQESRAQIIRYRRLHRRPLDNHQSLTDKVVDNIKSAPEKVSNFFKDLVS